jgi:membrane-bound metal-dependent hydrolase YbcI (DUF457 family)
MTAIGHALTGAAIGVAVLPAGSSRVRQVAQPAAFAILAQAPDIPFGDWGHEVYFYSHSLLANLLFVLLAGLLLSFSRTVCRRIGGWPVLAGGGLAWISHLLLDSFYNHGQGIGIFWPFSEGRLSLPIPWFSPLYGGLLPLTAEKVRILLIETASYLPLFIVAVLGRRLWDSSRLRALERKSKPWI